MVKIINQMTTENVSIFILEVDAKTQAGAKIRARGWAREEFPTKNPLNIQVEGTQNLGTVQSKIIDFTPDFAALNTYRTKVVIEE